MKQIFFSICFLLLAVSTSSQDKPLRVEDLQTTYSSGLSVGFNGQLIMTCKAAGPDPEDYYDCELAKGHTLTEVMRVVGRSMQEQNDSCQKATKAVMDGWKHTIDEWKKSNKDILKSLHPDKNGKS